MLISVTFFLFIIYSSHKLFIIKSQRKINPVFPESMKNMKG